MNDPKHSLLISIIAVTASIWSFHGTAEEAAPESLEQILQEAVSQSRAPGMGAVVVNGDGIIELSVVGLKRIDQSTPLESTDPLSYRLSNQTTDRNSCSPTC